jgi:hypothetical protein
MVKLKINNTQIEVEEGTILIDAANHVGIKIPTMCTNGEIEHFTSCMICIVKDAKNGKLIPSCTAIVENGMEIITDDDEIAEARKTALELLLSDHTGDCEAPCQIACPAFMNIPLMNRLIAIGQTEDALNIVRKDIALPGVLGRICSAPCEKACKRAAIDEAVSICLLKRFSYDNKAKDIVVSSSKITGKTVAVIGAGVAGLSAAYYLQIRGIQANIFDKNDYAGGEIRYSIPDDKLDKAVLDNEIEIIKKTGVVFFQKSIIDKAGFYKLQQDYDAVIIACGNYSKEIEDWGIENNGKQVIVNKDNYKTNIDKVFAIGNGNRPSQQAIRSAAQGKDVAQIIISIFNGKDISNKKKRFNSSTGKIIEQEFSEYLKESNSKKRLYPISFEDGFSFDEAQIEASRCLHCDCRKPNDCKLRDYSDLYNANRKRFSYSQRKPVKKLMVHESIIYEPGKCIKCGICVRITAKYKEEFGFTFIGRGFDVEVAIPFDKKMEQAFIKTAELVAKECPTGALARKRP